MITSLVLACVVAIQPPAPVETVLTIETSDRGFGVKEGEVYRCERCGHVYKRGTSMISCAVAHGPNDCCHYTDKLIEEGGAPPPIKESDKTIRCPVCGSKAVEVECASCGPELRALWKCPHDGLLFTAPVKP